jgi:hypothetical protein
MDLGQQVTSKLNTGAGGVEESTVQQPPLPAQPPPANPEPRK